MGIPHVLAVPYPAQGHVIPLMELAQWLASNGIRVTFVNTEFNHKRIVKSLSSEAESINKLISLASIPDGLEAWEDRNDLGKLAIVLPKAIPQGLEAVIQKINATESDQVTCVITDYGLTYALALAHKLGIKKKSAFLPAPLALLALARHARNLVDQGILDTDGTPLKQDYIIKLSEEMPAMRIQDSAWLKIGDFATQKLMFQSIASINAASETLHPDWIVCNSSHELEPGALKLLPQCTPLGPLLAANRLGQSAGFFWPEDSSTLSWLDQQQPNSTIYVAFGSFTVFDEEQFQELANGLELSNRPFLWVVRQDMTQDISKSYPKGFEERVKNRGKMVGWAPQQKVLSHPSVGCFLSHCGWNSTIEGVCNGVPFLCWPYFADQFLNQGYVVEYWRVGLRLERDGSGIVRGGEIVNKVEILMSDEGYKTRALELGSKATASTMEGGSSKKNFNSFLDWIKEK